MHEHEMVKRFYFYRSFRRHLIIIVHGYVLINPLAGSISERSNWMQFSLSFNFDNAGQQLYRTKKL